MNHFFIYFIEILYLPYPALLLPYPCRTPPRTYRNPTVTLQPTVSIFQAGARVENVAGPGDGGDAVGDETRLGVRHLPKGTRSIFFRITVSLKSVSGGYSGR